MEEKQTMTNEQLESNLKSLQIKATITKLLTYAAGAAMIIVWFFMGNLVMGLVLLVIALVFGYLSAKSSSTLKKLLSDNIIGGVLKEALGDAVEYNPWGKINPGSMVFPFSYNCAGGSDHIKAVYNGLNIELGDIELINETENTDENGNTQKNSQTCFKGQWLTCDFGKELSGQVYISEWTKKDRRSMKSNVTMDNEQFGKRFCVRADDPQEAYYILTPHMMEYIISIADKSGGTVYMSFLRDGKLHVAVQTGRDFFELGKNNANVEELRQKFLGELRWFTDIVDTLRVEDTLYKKESNI
ncbi:DUF3137 domain-containing protein [Zongyangia hominis]|uniref:DUF3137 domain-containing protein n=1 Tax=Zongyangia hominis TaxID=2763677 RepID=A0A926IBC1_9FIRM|nr:DUF3137 domain-containing protein [Zongyangia hominis]MBC8570017.1 DUF3137 domain-containing protein [Zongyangia hominis]